MGHVELSKKTWTNMRGDTLDADDYGRINRERLEAEAAIPAHVRARQAADRLEDETRDDMRIALRVDDAAAAAKTPSSAAEWRRLGRRLRTARESASTIIGTLPDYHAKGWRGEFIPLLDEAIAAAASGWRKAAQGGGRSRRRRRQPERQQRPGQAAGASSAASYCTYCHGPDSHSGPNHDGPCHKVIRQVQGFAGEGDVTLSCKCKGRVRPTAGQEVITIG